MQVLGNNGKFGAKKVNLGGNRYASPSFDKTERFPFGVLGLVPVVTSRRGGGKDVFYAFKDEADDAALVDAAEAVNDLLYEASSCSKHEFGMIEGIQIGIPAQGWGFCRVEYTPFDKRGNASEIPVRLYLETSTDPGAAHSLSATVDYDGEGRIVRIGAREYQADANCIEVIGGFWGATPVVDKVEAITVRTGHTRLIYKRARR